MARAVVASSAGLAALLAAGAFWLGTRTAPSAAPQSAASPGVDTNAVVERLNRRIAALEANQRRRSEGGLKISTNARPTDTDAGVSEADDAREGPNIDEADAIARSRQRAAERRLLLDEKLGGEPVDPAWAPATRARLETALEALHAKTFPKTRATSIDCRKTLCRVAVEGPDESERSAFIQEAMTSVPMRTFAVADEPGAPDSSWTLFFGREGEKLTL